MAFKPVFQIVLMFASKLDAILCSFENITERHTSATYLFDKMMSLASCRPDYLVRRRFSLANSQIQARSEESLTHFLSSKRSDAQTPFFLFLND